MIIRDRKFYAMFFALTIPIMLQDLLKFGLGLIDNIMVGSLSEVDISGVSMANQPFFLFALMLFGLSSGSAVLAAQYYGKGELEPIRQITGITLLFCTSISLIFMTLMLTIPDVLISIFTNNTDVISTGARYARIVAPSFLLYGITSTFVFSLRSVHIVKPTLVISGITFVMNIFLNWVLIFGNLGFPKLGIEGAAWATLFARIAEVIAISVFIFGIEKKLKYRTGRIFKSSKLLIKDMLKYSMPVMINEGLWSAGMIVTTAIIGRLSVEVIAAASITSNIHAFFNVAIFATSSGTAIVVGNAIGEGKTHYARQRAYTTTLLSLVMGVFVAGLMLATRQPLLSLYNITDITYSYCMDFLIAIAVMTAIDSVSLNLIVGVLRGGGDTKFALYADVLTLWFVAIPFGLLAYYLGWPVIVIYIALHTDTILKAVLCVPRMFGKKWIRNVTRAEFEGNQGS